MARAVDKENMAREKDCAQKRQPVAVVDPGEALAAGTQKIESHERDNRADPVHELHAELHEQTEEGDEDDIHGGNKAGFSDRRVDDAVLLDDAGRAENHAADYAANELMPRLLPSRADRDSLFVAQEDDRYKHKAGEKVSCRLHGKGPYIVHALALGDERRAPDHGAEQKHQAAAGLLFHGKISFV